MDYYNCIYCNKIYKSMSSRSNHYKINHSDKYAQDQAFKLKTTLNCTICGKTFANRHSRYRHESACKQHNVDSLMDEIDELKQTIHDVLNQNKIHPKKLQKINRQLALNNTNNINNINNGVIFNNMINIVKFGSENFSNIFSEDEVIKLLNRKRMSIEESVKMIHFNKARPEYQNVYITNLRNEYAYIYDGTKFISVYKTEVLNEIIDNHLDNIELSLEEYKTKISNNTYEILHKFIEMMNDDETELYVDEHKKKYSNFKEYKLNQLKLMIYNNTDKQKNLINVIYKK